MSACADCRTEYPDAETACPSCASRAYATPPLVAQIESASPREDALAPSPGPLFLHIPIARLILLSIASCGLYEAYWIYKNWRYIKEREGLQIYPFWRGLFGVFFCHSLLKAIHDDNSARDVSPASFSPSSLATGWVILTILGNFISRAPEPIASIIAFVLPTWLCLVPVQNYVNSLCESQSPTADYHGWSSGHIVCLVFGLIVWGLTLLSFGVE